MDDQKLEFLPFHSINEFMRPDFRLSMLKSALSALPGLDSSVREPVNRLVKKLVKIPGFRHSEKAPTMIKLLPCAQVFEKNADFVAAVIAAWSEAHIPLREQMVAVFQKRGWYFFPTEIKSITDFPLPKTESEWGILPPAADRTRLPGFVIYWPHKENFDELYTTYTELFPEGEASMDEVGLMAVWLSMRLPYHHTGEPEDPDAATTESPASEETQP
jgi:hypothetical protein